MAKWVIVFLLLLAAVVGVLYALVYLPKQAELDAARREASLCAQESSALKNRAADLESVRDELQRASTDLQARVRAKEEELAALRSTQDELLGELKQEIAEGQVQVERLRDSLRVDLVDEILFDSGEATLKPAGVEVLKRLGAVLKKAENRHVEVQGHTDNVPILGALARRYPTNWELSSARAVNVARFLQDTAKLDPTRLSATAHSEYQPRATNDTEAGRQKNRRIEILLAPVLPMAKAEVRPGEK